MSRMSRVRSGPWGGGWCWWARERSQSAAPVPVPARTPEERRQGLGAAVRGLELVAGGLVGGVAWTISLRAVGAWPSLVVAAPMVWRRVWGVIVRDRRERGLQRSGAWVAGTVAGRLESGLMLMTG